MLEKALPQARRMFPHFNVIELESRGNIMAGKHFSSRQGSWRAI
jgi:hypothetical protein